MEVSFIPFFYQILKINTKIYSWNNLIPGLQSDIPRPSLDVRYLSEMNLDADLYKMRL